MKQIDVFPLFFLSIFLHIENELYTLPGNALKSFVVGG
jgi:hypothetical protein